MYSPISASFAYLVLEDIEIEYLNKTETKNIIANQNAIFQIR